MTLSLGEGVMPRWEFDRIRRPAVLLVTREQMAQLTRACYQPGVDPFAILADLFGDRFSAIVRRRYSYIGLKLVVV